MMKKVGLFVFLLFIMVVLQQAVVGSSIAVTPGTQNVAYVPGASYELVFLIQGAPGQEFDIRVGGELADYLELPSDLIAMDAMGIANIKVRFTVPEISNPGEHSAELVVAEKPEERIFGTPANVRAYAAVHAPIKVYVPCPDKCADITFDASDASLGELTFLNMRIANTGSIAINAADGQIQIYDPENNVVAVIPLSVTQSIAPGASASLNSEWRTEGILGMYTGKATVNFDEYSRELEDGFKVGDLIVDINGVSPTQFYVGDIAPVVINIQSKWGQEINNIYALVEIKDSGNATLARAETPTLPGLSAWSNSNLNTFLTFGGVPVGNYTAKVKLYYAQKTNEKEFPITVETKPIITQEEKKFTFDGTFAVLIILTVMIAGLAYAYTKKKRQRYG